MATILRLLRFPNLIIVALTQYLVFYLVFLPAYTQQGQIPVLQPTLLFLLVLTTVLIAGGGYVINDIVDYEIDLINKPDKVFVGKSISKQQAYRLYYGMSILGFLLATYIAIQTHNLPFLYIYPIAVILLYGYSTHLKKMPFIGNVVVALFCAFVPGILLLAEQSRLLENSAYVWTAWYALFAFWTTLVREIVKDIEDIEGDRAAACRTLPLVTSPKTAKVFAVLFMFFIMLSYVGLYFFNNKAALTTPIWTYLILGLPTLYIFIRLIIAKHKSDFSHLSFSIKILMVLGLFFLFLI